MANSLVMEQYVQQLNPTLTSRTLNLFAQSNFGSNPLPYWGSRIFFRIRLYSTLTPSFEDFFLITRALIHFVLVFGCNG